MASKTPKFIRKIHTFLDSLHMPMLGISLWKMLEIYIGGIFRNQVIKQAASISWSFFLSLFPFILFLLSILPYLPHYDKLQFYIFEVLLHRILPANIHAEVTQYIGKNIIPNLESISNYTIVLALIFATNGTFSFINGFNENTDSKRGIVKEYLIAFAITLGFISVIFLTLSGVYYAEIVLKLFTPQYDLTWFTDNLTKIISFFSFPLFYFILLALFYWVGAVKITKIKHTIPGALLTTFLFMVTTYGFAIYIKDFARYNFLYGSIGSILLLMVWVNVNVVLILFGNELNLAIKKLRMEKMISEEILGNTEDFELETSEMESIPPSKIIHVDDSEI